MTDDDSTELAEVRRPQRDDQQLRTVIGRLSTVIEP
jgi:hypothetical protein